MYGVPLAGMNTIMCLDEREQKFFLFLFIRFYLSLLFEHNKTIFFLFGGFNLLQDNFISLASFLSSFVVHVFCLSCRL